MNLFEELKRRNVFRMAIFYVVSGWLLLQITDLIFEVLLVPDWTLRFLFAVLLGAFPFVLFFAWAFELTPDGIKREADVDRSGSVAVRTGRKIDRVIVGLLAVLIAIVLGERFLDDSPGSRVTGNVPQAVAADPEVSAPASPVVLPAPSSGPEGHSIAVLPFANMSSNAENEFFSDGLSEALLHLLARIPDLQVAARTSAFKFKGMNEDVRLIGEQLNVAHVLEGSVQRSGDRVRITVQLIKADDGYHLWSETFDRTLDDVFAVQDDIASRVTEALEVTLLGDVPRSQVVDTAVFDDFLRARALLARGGTEDNLRAIGILVDVVARQPDFALAHAQLAGAYLRRAYGGALYETVVPLGEEAAKRAIALDPGLADGYRVLSYVRAFQLREDEALAAAERAIALAPNDIEIVLAYVGALSRNGRHDEALLYADKARRLDPLNPRSSVVSAETLMHADRLEAAGELLGESLANWPTDLRLLDAAASLEQQRGDFAASIALRERIARLDPGNFANWQRQFEIYMDLGGIEAAGRSLAHMRDLSLERAYDEIAEFELFKGNADAFRDYARRYLEARTWATEKMLLGLAVIEGRFDDAIEEVVSGEIIEGTITPWRYRDELFRQALLASLANSAGDHDAHASYLAKAEALFDEMRKAKGGHDDSSGLLLSEAALFASAGRAAEATRTLRRAFDLGWRDMDEIVAGWVWMPIRQSPEYAEMIAGMNAVNATTLAEIAAISDF